MKKGGEMKICLILLTCLFFSTCAFAASVEDNSGVNVLSPKQGQAQDQGQSQGQIGINEQGQGQGQDQGQGQLQGQMQGQSALQGNDQQIISNDETNVNTFVPPLTPALTGTDNMNASSPLFNAGISTTKKYKMLNEEYILIQNMKRDGYLDKDEAEIEARRILIEYKKETKSKRILGLAFEGVCRNSLIGFLPVCF